MCPVLGNALRITGLICGLGLIAAGRILGFLGFQSDCILGLMTICQTRGGHRSRAINKSPATAGAN
jgi:hypothetical protein